MKQLKILLIISSITLLAACSTLMLQPANFAWPLETVLKIDDEGNVKEDRYALNFNTKTLFFEETQDSLAYLDKTIRLIRNNEGYYFMTAVNFKNVYVFSVDKNAFALKTKILISETKGLSNPAFNQRSPYIELLDDGRFYKLTSEGIEEGAK
jgi:hypothetical protein